MSDTSSDSFDGLAFDERTTTENFQQRLIQAQFNDEENEPLNNNSIVWRIDLECDSLSLLITHRVYRNSKIFT
jgi:hypothetical protein